MMARTTMCGVKGGAIKEKKECDGSLSEAKRAVVMCDGRMRVVRIRGVLYLLISRGMDEE